MSLRAHVEVSAWRRNWAQSSCGGDDGVGAERLLAGNHRCGSTFHDKLVSWPTWLSSASQLRGRTESSTSLVSKSRSDSRTVLLSAKAAG